MTYGTMEKIQTVTVGSGGAASIDFTSIPATYDDLVIKVSARQSSTAEMNIQFNGSTSNLSDRVLYAIGGVGVGSNPSTTAIRTTTSWSNDTASTFGSSEIYIPNYRGNTNKSISVDSVQENNSSSTYSLYLTAGLWSNTAAITSIKLIPSSGTLLQHSTATLYGITRVPAGAKATGGVITDTDTHWIHTFTSSGTFTPTANITCDYLVVAGGGGGGGDNTSDQGGGGGGGGGFLTSSLSLTASTNYTVQVGGGGAGGSGWNAGSRGTDSIFGSVTSNGGGGGGRRDNGGPTGTLGSGGGAGSGGTAGSGANGTAGQGNKGGDNNALNPYGAGGGGGAGAAGGAGGTVNIRTGGNGLASSISGSSVFYAGGGGGGCHSTSTFAAAGGLGGGGGAPANNGGAGGSGTANTGGGGGGASGVGSGGTGGSGIVIVRYAK